MAMAFGCKKVKITNKNNIFKRKIPVCMVKEMHGDLL